jgi:glycosyltransferase involved in cell wall biosynthesis/ADP-heptose:LPS heptosyltransferase
MNPKVSVCIPTYNYAKYLPETIESVLSQTFTDYELIIIDDCSTDHTKDIGLYYASNDKRISFSVNSSNIGMVKNWNLCLSVAKGDYIRYVFGDDLLIHKDAIAKMVDILDSNNDIALVSSSRKVIDENSNEKKILSHFRNITAAKGTAIINKCLSEQKNLIGEPSVVMFRRNNATRGFNEKYKQLVDLEFWFHLLEQGKFAYIDEPLTAFRIHLEQQGKKNWENGVGLDETQYLFDEYLHKSYINISDFRKSYIIYDYNYQKWKAYKEKRISKRQAIEEINHAYGIGKFYIFLPLYKLYKPFLKLKKYVHNVLDIEGRYSLNNVINGDIGGCICVVRSMALGDCIMATGVIKHLKELNPLSSIVVCTEHPYAFENNRDVAKIYDNYKKMRRYCDKVYDLNMVSEKNPTVHRIKAYADFVFGEGNYKFSDVKPVINDRTDVDINVKINNLGAFLSRKYIVIHPSKSWVCKEMSKEHWNSIVRGLINKGYRIVQVGKSIDVQPDPVYRFYNFSDKLTLSEIRHLISRASLFVGIDSGIFHIAQSTKTKCVGIFSVCDPNLIVWREKDTWVVTPNSKCKYCLNYKLTPPITNVVCERGDNECISSISPEDVLKVCALALDE